MFSWGFRANHTKTHLTDTRFCVINFPMDNREKIEERLSRSLFNLTHLFGYRSTTYLYHYTTPKGFHGIFEEKAIWATNTKYLNDPTETKIALDRLKAILPSLKSCFKPARGFDYFQKFLTNYNSKGDFCVGDYTIIDKMRLIRNWPGFICSFSEEGDLLSQWRAYCPGGGFAIGLPVSYLKKATPFTLLKCAYTKTEQKKVLSKIVKHIYKLFSGIEWDSDENYDNYYIAMIPSFLEILSFMFKHEGFQEERESRLCFLNCPGNEENIKVRVTDSMLVPYVSYKLEISKPLQELKVIVGPTRYPEKSRQSVIDYLKSKDFMADESNVILSEVPYQDLR